MQIWWLNDLYLNKIWKNILSNRVAVDGLYDTEAVANPRG